LFLGNEKIFGVAGGRFGVLDKELARVGDIALHAVPALHQSEGSGRRQRENDPQ